MAKGFSHIFFRGVQYFTLTKIRAVEYVSLFSIVEAIRHIIESRRNGQARVVEMFVETKESETCETVEVNLRQPRIHCRFVSGALWEASVTSCSSSILSLCSWIGNVPRDRTASVVIWAPFLTIFPISSAMSVPAP